MTTEAQAIIRQSANGKAVLEYYVNGQRAVEPFSLDEFGLAALRAALAEVAISNHALAQAQAEKKLLAERKRHNKVWSQVAESPGQGIAFANRTIGQPLGTKLPAITDLQRVCYCNREWPLPPFAKKCPGCPGPYGAGKIERKTHKVPGTNVADALALD